MGALAPNSRPLWFDPHHPRALPSYSCSWQMLGVITEISFSPSLSTSGLWVCSRQFYFWASFKTTGFGAVGFSKYGGPSHTGYANSSCTLGKRRQFSPSCGWLMGNWSTLKARRALKNDSSGVNLLRMNLLVISPPKGILLSLWISWEGSTSIFGKSCNGCSLMARGAGQGRYGFKDERRWGAQSRQGTRTPETVVVVALERVGLEWRWSDPWGSRLCLFDFRDLRTETEVAY